MYPFINQKIRDILDNIASINVIYQYPTNKIDKYPAVVYYPSAIDNSMDSMGENMKEYSFKLWIIVNAEESNIDTVFNDVMPGVIDDVISGFDENWDFNTVDGHRVWCKVSQGVWSVTQEQAGIEVSAELNIIIKTLTSN